MHCTMENCLRSAVKHGGTEQSESSVWECVERQWTDGRARIINERARARVDDGTPGRLASALCRGLAGAVCVPSSVNNLNYCAGPLVSKEALRYGAAVAVTASIPTSQPACLPIVPCVKRDALRRASCWQLRDFI